MQHPSAAHASKFSFCCRGGMLFVAGIAFLVLMLWPVAAIAQWPSISPPQVNASAFLSLDQLAQACASLSSSGCTVSVDSQQTWQIGGDFRVPHAMHLHFTERGRWGVRGGNIDFQNATIEAPEATQVFEEGTAVRGLSAARPEWFASRHGDVYPAHALAQAYRATVEHGTIMLRAAMYLSPFSIYRSVNASPDDQMSLDSPRLLLGSGRPTVNDEHDPRRLVGGSIILGEVRGTAALRAVHLGVDDGPDVVRDYFAGQEAFGLCLWTTQKLGVIGGTVLQDIAVLTNGVRNQHPVIIEGQYGLTVQGLWLWSAGGTHGLIIKSSNAIISDYHCTGAPSDCLLIKSDFATERTGYASHVVISGAYLKYLKTPGDTGGIAVDAQQDSVLDLTLRDIHEIGTTRGISVGGSLFHNLRGLRVEDWHASDIQANCMVAVRVQAVDVSNFDCSLRAGMAGPAFLLHGKGFHIHDGVISCVPGETTCASAALDGIRDESGKVVVERVTGVNLGGYLLRTRQAPDPASSGLKTVGMNGRTIAPLGKSQDLGLFGFQDWKFHLRMLWRMLRTHSPVHPGWLLLLTGLLWFPASSAARRFIAYKAKRSTKRPTGIASRPA